MELKKSEGVTPTEKLLANFCNNTFLKLWSYPNPYNENRDELCDLLAVFENHVFIFFDREKLLLEDDNKDPEIKWKRWKKKVIGAQLKTANGAERYILSGRKIYLDQEIITPFPIIIDPEKAIIHKIIIAHGAKEACKQSSIENIYGSLAISYGSNEKEFPFPFFIDLQKDKPAHIFDSHNLPIIFSELDTFYDFSAYLIAKEKAISKYDSLCYCGEEDLLAHYFMNFDNEAKCHYIGTLDEGINGIFIGEGEWHDFKERKEYKAKKQADKISYFWDNIIQKTCDHTLDGTILGDRTPLDGKSAIHEMAKEPRFHRRYLSSYMIKAIQSFPESTEKILRNLSFMPSFSQNKAYLFLQLKVQGFPETYEEYREKRRTILEIACGTAKNKYKHLKTIVGIAIDAPKYSKINSEDFILMECKDWSAEQEKYYRDLNKDWKFLETDNLKMQFNTATEFPKPTSNTSSKIKIGRNAPCPCGSGKKYKKCCGNIKYN
jgi:uncharacterized protein YecA (UPF0149 family)